LWSILSFVQTLLNNIFIYTQSRGSGRHSKYWVYIICPYSIIKYTNISVTFSKYVHPVYPPFPTSSSIVCDV
jgi:hypothetical protein